jgi:hypothetical protein
MGFIDGDEIDGVGDPNEDDDSADDIREGA